MHKNLCNCGSNMPPEVSFYYLGYCVEIADGKN